MERTRLVQKNDVDGREQDRYRVAPDGSTESSAWAGDEHDLRHKNRFTHLRLKPLSTDVPLPGCIQHVGRQRKGPTLSIPGECLARNFVARSPSSEEPIRIEAAVTHPVDRGS